MTTWRRRLRITRARRRLVAAACLASAAVLAVTGRAPAPAAAVQVLSAAHDLAPGTLLTTADVASVGLPPDAVPDGALASASALVGRLLSAGMRRGEPFTDVRLVGAGLLPPGDDRVVAPVRLADAAAVSVLRAGDRISVIAVPGSSAASGRATQVVGHALVLAVPAAGGTPDGAGSGSGLGAPSASTDPLDGALVLLALSTPEATSLAAAARAGSLSFVLDPAPAPSFGGPSP